MLLECKYEEARIPSLLRVHPAGRLRVHRVGEEDLGKAVGLLVWKKQKADCTACLRKI